MKNVKGLEVSIDNGVFQSVNGLGFQVDGNQSSKSVVLLHGWGSSSRTWNGLMHNLGDEFCVVSVDLPGSGRSRKMASCSIELMADTILSALSAQSISTFILVGHSMGANVATQIALSAPERVKGIVLIAAALYSERPFATKIYVHPIFGWPTLIGARIFAGICTGLGLAIPKRWQNNEMRTWFLHRSMAFMDNSLQGLHSQMKELVLNPLKLTQVPNNLPVLLIHGQRDTVVPSAYAEEMFQSRSENSQLVVFPSADHCPMDNYAEELRDKILQFIAHS